MKTHPTIKLLIALAVCNTAGAFYAVPNKIDAVLYSLIGWAVVVLAHIFVLRRAERINYGRIYLPVFVVDWGPFGPAIRDSIPDEVSDVPVWFCPPHRVRDTEATIREKLTDAENPYYVRPTEPDKALPVHVRFFRDPRAGGAVETGDEYLTALVEDMKAAKRSFVEGLRANATSPKEFEEMYFGTGRNGSVLS